MLTLTDCPNEITGWFPGDCTWKQTDVQHLPESACRVWRALAPTSTASVLNPSTSFSPGDLRQLVVIREAPRSQFFAFNQLLREGTIPEDGTAVLALKGSDFRGHRGRAWLAVEGNLHVSVYCQLGRKPSEVGQGLQALPAVAVMDTLRAAWPEGPVAGIKWVNDIEVEGKKVAGVLTATQLNGDSMAHVLFGIGINVNQVPDVAPTPFVPEAGSLVQVYGEKPGLLPEIFWSLVDAVAGRIRELKTKGPEGILDAYRASSNVPGRNVRIWAEDAGESGETLRATAPLAAGIVESIESDFSLRIRGRTEPAYKGRLAFEESCARFGL